MIASDYFSPDIAEFLQCLDEYSVDYLIIGGEAVIYYGYPRLTGDIDLFYRNTDENISALFNTLLDFWEGDIPGINNSRELAEPGYVIQFGIPPNRIDLLNKIESVNFNEAWNAKTVEKFNIDEHPVPIYFIGLQDLINNKKQAGRPKDQDDLSYLRNIN